MNLWQHPLWGKFQEAIGRKTWQLHNKDASALVVRHPLPFGLCWLEVPRGPLAKEEKSFNAILGKIAELGKKEGAVFIRLSPFDSKFVTKSYKLKATSFDHHPQTSLVLNLSQSEDELLSRMKQKCRYNIHLAEKHGVTIRESATVGEFYELLEKTSDRDGFSVHAKSYYEHLLKALGAHAQLLVAEHDGQVIAGGIFVYLGDWGIYYYGASSNEHRNLMAPYLIQWTAIREAKKRGCKHYDFLGIAPTGAKNHPWAGVTDFKMKFGGEVVSYPLAREIVLRPFWDWAYRFFKKFR